MESDAHGGGASRAADEDPGAAEFAVGTARGSCSEPGGAGGQDDPGNPAGPGDAVSRGVHGGAGDLAGRRGPSAAGESGGGAGAIPKIPGPSHAPGPGGATPPAAAVLSNRAIQLYPIPGTPAGQAAAGARILTVPFTSHVDAGLARHILTARTQLRGSIRKELDVNGRMLVLRLTAEDPGLLQNSIVFCLEQLSLVMQSLQHFGGPVSRHRRRV
ncbi:cancer/testis antigen 1-like isoform X1 [Bubalus kerabau]|uniref:cancer/testis antigen 1-like isoform X1 n=1 Tax=Bubalus carabanensis TaxID=3119969 RepID=UPI00244EB753|nr:cancer/testis antigen 1-like isoform X1 [Bubalus carabanensis]XP_055419652.1 cancer/testis antigen 1-like isoform X1 [Bubalus carabanensis]XP_055419678.1 cancer/testis antigen 1-like isoform X1 [Bubalus carabanensis]